MGAVQKNLNLYNGIKTLINCSYPQWHFTRRLKLKPFTVKILSGPTNDVYSHRIPKKTYNLLLMPFTSYLEGKSWVT